MLETIIKTIWFFLPAAAANMAPVIFKRLPILSTPLDFNYTFYGRPILGKNKTWRGLLVGIILSIIITYFQKAFYSEIKFLTIIDYAQINVWLFGFLQGFGALFGDAFKSLIKRRLKKDPGTSWIPFDQIDWIIGANFFISIYIWLDAKYVFYSIIILTVLHPLINLIGYKLKLKNNRF
jgi:CDP-2,3-bis-(O-geranylgeranyl)-sn-glycerol synthase